MFAIVIVGLVFARSRAAAGRREVDHEPEGGPLREEVQVERAEQPQPAQDDPRDEVRTDRQTDHDHDREDHDVALVAPLVRADKPITRLRTTVTRDDGTVALEGEAVCYTMPLP